MRFQNIFLFINKKKNQTDVWTLLNGNKDDFLIYDRCGRLVYHLSLPLSILEFPYVEQAIKIAYCEEKCGNCSLTTLKDEDFCKNVSLASVNKTTEARSHTTTTIIITITTMGISTFPSPSSLRTSSQRHQTRLSVPFPGLHHHLKLKKAPKDRVTPCVEMSQEVKVYHSLLHRRNSEERGV